MEVHAHTHTIPIAIGRKKWNHYFEEFFQLYLTINPIHNASLPAVCCKKIFKRP